jgi:hypothetical protein
MSIFSIKFKDIFYKLYLKHTFSQNSIKFKVLENFYNFFFILKINLYKKNGSNLIIMIVYKKKMIKT